MTEDPIQKLKQRLQESKKSLSIARLPNKTKEDFMALANEEFCGDYGMTLREILNYYFESHAMKALFFQNIDMKLDYILENISHTEKTEETPETSGIKMCDGTKRFVRRKKENG